MPAHQPVEDGRERPCVAGIHAFLARSAKEGVIVFSLSWSIVTEKRVQTELTARPMSAPVCAVKRRRSPVGAAPPTGDRSSRK
jgi:hypothetical protein